MVEYLLLYRLQRLITSLNRSKVPMSSEVSVGLTSLRHIVIIALQNGKLKNIIQLTRVIGLRRVHNFVRLPLFFYLNLGCLGARALCNRSFDPFNGSLTRAPFCKCDSMNAKINSVLACATRTPQRDGSPVSSE